MLKSLLVSLCLSPTLLFAATCPSISGTFLTSTDPDYQRVVKFRQINCAVVGRSVGTITKEGALNLARETYHPLDKSYTCDQRDHCTYASISRDGVEWSLNHNGMLSDPTHGGCKYRSYIMVKLENGDLRSIYEASNCSKTGFSGSIKKIFPRVLQK